MLGGWDSIDAWTGTVVVLGLAIVLVAERWLVNRRAAWFFRLAFPLGATLLPLARAPRGRGRGRGLAWEVSPDGASVLFWAEAGGLRGLHGVAYLQRDHQGRIHLDVRWSPWWTALAACLALSVVGAVRGELVFTTPIATLMAGAVLYGFWQVALDAAEGLRLSLLESEDEDRGR